MHRSGRSKKEKSSHNPPPQSRGSPPPASGFAARKPREGKGEGLGRERGTWGARLRQGKENKVNFGNQMTVLADSTPLLSCSISSCSSKVFIFAVLQVASGEQSERTLFLVWQPVAMGEGISSALKRAETAFANITKEQISEAHAAAMRHGAMLPLGS